MSRTKGLIISSIYEPAQRKPFDARQLVSKREDLINPSIWIPTGLTATTCYNGMITAVSNDGEHNGLYILIDRTAITEDNYNAYQNALLNSEDISEYFDMWVKFSTTQDISLVTDSITELSERLAELENGSGSDPESESVLTFAQFSQFPSVGEEGVLYTALDKHASYVYSDGEYVCVGSEGESLDVSVIYGGNAD